MLSNQILHKTAQDIREITGFDCAIWDMQGLCLVRTNENLTEYELQIQDFRDDEEEPDEMILDEMGMFRIYEDSDPTYILMLKGNADGMELAGRMGASQLRNLLYAYKERMDNSQKEVHICFLPFARSKLRLFCLLTLSLKSSVQR